MAPKTNESAAERQLKGQLPKDHPDATTQITLRFSNAELALIGQAAKERHVTRAALIRLATFQYIKNS